MSNSHQTAAFASHDARSPHAPEADLIARAKRGDRAALGTLLGAFRPRALAAALRVLRDRDQAEDAVQDAFIKVCRAIGRFEERAAFGTWLHRIVVNTSLDHLRRAGGRPVVTEGDVGDDGGTGDRALPGREIADDRTPDRDVERMEARAAITRGLATLTPVHRQALVLREIEDSSYAEIARASGCPVGTVMSRLHHARRRLADELAPAWSPTALRAA